MLHRIFAVALNTYREAVRARVLFGIVAAAFATIGYSVVISAMSLHNETRVITDVAAASTSLFSVVVAIVLGAMALHREIELKTIYPILTRKLRRPEYVVGKYVGVLLTVLTFIAMNGAVSLFVLSVQAGVSALRVGAVALLFIAALTALLVRLPRYRSHILLPWSLGALAAFALVATPLQGERQILLAQLALTLAEASIVTAVAMLFSSFSSPFLTATFSLGVFLVGRSADTLGNLPVRIFGPTIRQTGIVLAHIFPNLNVYVPARPLLLGEVDGVPVLSFVARASVTASLYALVLLALSSLIFQKRDFS